MIRKHASPHFLISATFMLLLQIVLTAGFAGSFGQQIFGDEKQTDGAETITENTLKFSKDQPAVEASPENFDFLAGYWVGNGLGGNCEETWMPDIEGSRIGTFRFHQDGKLIFSEFFQLAKHGDRWTLRLRHFDEELKGWEDKEKFVEFPLVRIEKNTAWFNGLTYKLMENDELHVMLAMKHKDGSVGEEKFIFKRKPLTDQGSR
ncbi:MAG: hypothetical protein JNL58_15380 [Planctomyces sp.]|nr:hypothetical protein [Planctomyces sp.]